VVDKAKLSAAQAATALLPHAMAGYVGWLAPQMGTLAEDLAEDFHKARDFASSNDMHLRVPEVIANLWVGFGMCIQYARGCGACTATEAEGLLDRGWGALSVLASAQGKAVEEERPSRRFLRALVTLLTTHRAFVLPRNEAPVDRDIGSEFLGWADHEYLYLQPDATYGAVQRFCRESGTPLSLSLDRLKRDLVREGLSEAEDGRRTTTAKIAGKTRRVLKLSRSAIEALVEESIPAAASAFVTTVTGSRKWVSQRICG
jgi:hypothetical protein